MKSKERGASEKNTAAARAKVMIDIAKTKAAQGSFSEALDWLSRASAIHKTPEIAQMIANMGSASRRKSLHGTYVSKLIPVLMDVRDDAEAGARVRALVLSSPIMTTCFVKFMQHLTVTVCDDVVVHFFVDDASEKPVYIKDWEPFSWMVPFMAELSIDGIPPIGRAPNWSYEMLSRTSNVMNFFQLWLPDWIQDPLDPHVMPFIRRQLPNFQQLNGPIDFFLELPKNPPVPKKFKNVSLFIRKFSDLRKLFESKRFSTPVLEFKFIQPWNQEVDFAYKFTIFLKNLRIRMPETNNMMIRMPVLSARYPFSDMVNALCTVFPNLRVLNLLISLDSDDVNYLDYSELVNNTRFFKQQTKKMPPHLFVRLNFEEMVEFADEMALFLCYERDPPSGFTWLTSANQNPLNPPSDGFITKNSHLPVFHKNKFFNYEVVFN